MNHTKQQNLYWIEIHFDCMRFYMYTVDFLCIIVIIIWPMYLYYSNTTIKFYCGISSYGNHELMVHYSVSICTMRTNLCHNCTFLFCLPWTWLFMSSSVGVSKNQKTLTLTVQLVHAPSFKWSQSCSFTFDASLVLFWLF